MGLCRSRLGAIPSSLRDRPAGVLRPHPTGQRAGRTRGFSSLKSKKPLRRGFLRMAERVGFEPTVGLHLRLISSQVHSTTLPPLRSAQFYQLIDPLLSAIRVSPSFGDKLLPVPKPETGYSDRNDIYPQILVRAFFKGMRACCPGHAGKLRQFRVACPALRLDP